MRPELDRLRRDEVVRQKSIEYDYCSLDEMGSVMEYLACEYRVGSWSDDSDQSEQYEQVANSGRQRAQCYGASPMSQIR